MGGGVEGGQMGEVKTGHTHAGQAVSTESYMGWLYDILGI